MDHSRIAPWSTVFFLGTSAFAAAQSVLGQSTVTPPAATEQAALCTADGAYPPEWEWTAAQKAMPKPAASGTPRIDQIRGGQVIATYSSFANQPGCTYLGQGQDQANPAPAAASGCGPFTRSHAPALWKNGDQFNVQPAIYTGPYNQIYVGPTFVNDSDPNLVWVPPSGITIHGVVTNGFMPNITSDAGATDNTLNQSLVYIDSSAQISIDHVAVTGTGNVTVGNSGVYNAGGQDLTLSWVVISGFGPNQVMTGGANGLLSGGGATGTLALRHVELAFNGGNNGPRHNAYISASATDPNFKVVLDHSYSHDVVYGHLFKSRAQKSHITYNYFRGGLPQPGQTQAENYDLDLPNGGFAKVQGNIFVKAASGPDSNAMSLTYGMEGLQEDGRANTLDAENNTFVALARTYDGTSPLFPISLFYPQQIPGTPGWPAGVKATIRNNVFAGYCPAGNPVPDYRGDMALTAALGEVNQDYTLTTNYLSADSDAVGSGQYAHVAGSGRTRIQATFGAMDY